MHPLRKTGMNLLIIYTLTFIFVPTVIGQEKRLVPFPTWAASYEEGEEIQLELLEFKVAGDLIALGQPFYAGEDWLKKITMRVKNISSQPLPAFSIGGGLLRGVDEELPPNASFYHGITWSWGKRFDPERGERPAAAMLKPGEVVELSYENVARSNREVLAKEGEGALHKLMLSSPWIQYADGTTGHAEMRVYGKGKP